MDATYTTLEDLPLELLNEICELVDACWLPNIRLTCRTLKTAAHEAFTSQYLRELSCYVLEPSRRERLKNLISSPELAAKVRKLTLTADCFEWVKDGRQGKHRWEAMATVDPMQLPRSSQIGAQLGCCRAYETERHEMYNTIKPDLSTLAATLCKLDRSRCVLSVDLFYLHFNSFTRERGHEKFTGNRFLLGGLLDVISAAGFPLQRLHVSDLTFVSTDHADTARDSLLKGLRSFQLSLRRAPSEHDTLNLLGAVAKMEQLESFGLSFGAYFNSDLRNNPEATSVMTRMLQASRFRALRELDLSMVRPCGFGIVHTVFAHCQDTLQSLSMYAVMIRSESNSSDEWRGIIENVQGLPQLMELYIYEVGIAGDDADFLICGKLAKDDRKEPQILELEATSREEVKSTVMELLDCGLVLIEQEPEDDW